jgi:hypothetical protein
VQALTVAPSARIDPKLDGRVTTYFEWLGAGLCQPDYRSGSMHGVAQLVEALYYGFSDTALFLRVDLGDGFIKQHPDFEIRVNVNVNNEPRARLHSTIGTTGVKKLEFLKGRQGGLETFDPGHQVEAAFARIFEARIDLSLLDVTQHDRLSLQVSVWLDGLPVQLLPQEGWLNLALSDEMGTW